MITRTELEKSQDLLKYALRNAIANNTLENLDSAIDYISDYMEQADEGGVSWLFQALRRKFKG